jgi:hypothetical protein
MKANSINNFEQYVYLNIIANCQESNEINERVNTKEPNYSTDDGRERTARTEP